MEESKDLIVGYKIFRSLVYVSLILEFFIYAVDPAVVLHLCRRPGRVGFLGRHPHGHTR